MKKILFILSLFLILGVSCKTDEVEQSNVVLKNSAELQKCLDITEEDYLLEKHNLCQAKEMGQNKRVEDCEKIYYPWKQQGIDRDQYCRNTTVETADPGENYKDCMIDLPDSIKISFNACIGMADSLDDNGCALASNIQQELEKNRDKEQEECYNLYSN